MCSSNTAFPLSSPSEKCLHFLKTWNLNELLSSRFRSSQSSHTLNSPLSSRELLLASVLNAQKDEVLFCFLGEKNLTFG
jgi:hypothetical protein